MADKTPRTSRPRGVATQFGQTVSEAERVLVTLVADELKLPITETTPIASPAVSVRAVAHQWAHAVARVGFEFIVDSAGQDADSANLLFGIRGPRETQRVFEQIRALLGAAFGDLTSLRQGLQACRVHDPFQPQSEEGFTFADLFAGIGGMRLGVQRAGGKCVFSSEFDRYAQQTYLQNHGELPFGDITAIEPADIPDHDVLVGGFPCQPFSHAGLKLGIADPRGTLFGNIARIAEVKKPKVILLENVRGLISHDGGLTLATILHTLTNCGYRSSIPLSPIQSGLTSAHVTEIQRAALKLVLSSSDFGVPQRRNRIFIVLVRNDLPQASAPISLPVRPKKAVHDRGVMLASILGTPSGREDDFEFCRISPRLFLGHLFRRQRNAKAGKGFGFGMVVKVPGQNEFAPGVTRTISARYHKDGGEILIWDHEEPPPTLADLATRYGILQASDYSQYTGPCPRKITRREAALLQGFPETFHYCVSRPQAYKQFGNSVTVNVVAAVARTIAAWLQRPTAPSQAESRADESSDGRRAGPQYALPF